MDVLTYFDQATIAILHGQGCSPEQALRLARDLVDRRGKFVEEMGLVEDSRISDDAIMQAARCAIRRRLAKRPAGTDGEGEG